MRSRELSADEMTRKLYLEGQAGLTRGREKGKNGKSLFTHLLPHVEYKSREEGYWI